MEHQPDPANEDLLVVEEERKSFANKIYGKAFVAKENSTSFENSQDQQDQSEEVNMGSNFSSEGYENRVEKPMLLEDAVEALANQRAAE